MFDLGQCVGLGSDGFYDIPNEAVLASLLQTLDQRDPSAFSTSQALEMVYGNNCRYAEKVFGCQLGRVVPGYAADLILLEYNPPTPITQSNLQSHVLAALTGGALRSSVINGRVVFKGGKVMGVDEADVMERGRRRAERLWARL
jgi:cytosine/adenosine deaminase-related metal-dependent hydrolase